MSGGRWLVRRLAAVRCRVVIPCEVGRDVSGVGDAGEGVAVDLRRCCGLAISERS